MVTRISKSDLQCAAVRALAVLQKLDEHESNVSANADPDAVMAVRFALLDSARAHLKEGLENGERARRERIGERLEIR